LRRFYADGERLIDYLVISAQVYQSRTSADNEDAMLA